MEQSHSTGARPTEADRLAAREIDPTPYLESQGYTVRHEGRHLSAQVNGDEVYRLTQEPDGHWIWCDNYGERGGDNISLVQEIQPQTRYIEAVYQLSGGASVEPLQPRPAAPPRRPPNVPVQHYMDRIEGREYLQNRGISSVTLDHAEKAGMLQYSDGAVLFVGRASELLGREMNVTRRAIKESDPVQKRDLKGSDKSFPPVLPGDPSKVWIVEGGTDALALRDLAVRNRQHPPTVIVSGGANVRSFLERADVQEILKKADRVTIAGEREKSPDAQARADQGHQRQADRVQEITGREVRQWTPPKAKDLAEHNLEQQKTPHEKHIERQQQEGTKTASMDWSAGITDPHVRKAMQDAAKSADQGGDDGDQGQGNSPAPAPAPPGPGM